jgi:hypothetical protein
MSERDFRTKAASVFLGASAYIRKYGWQREGMSRHGKPRCSMGALESSYPRRKWNKKLAETMYKALYKQLGGITLTEFNHKFNNGEKVANLFERTARSLQGNL